MTTYYICKGCGAESPTGIGYVSNEKPTSRPHPLCPNPHVQAPAPVIARTTARSRNDNRQLAEFIRLNAWRVQELVEADEFDTDEVIGRLGLIISYAKDLDRKVKNRRRAAARQMQVMPMKP